MVKIEQLAIVVFLKLFSNDIMPFYAYSNWMFIEFFQHLQETENRYKLSFHIKKKLKKNISRFCPIETIRDGVSR